MPITSPARAAMLAAALVAGCATGPSPTPTAAVGAVPVQPCDALAAAFRHPGTTLQSAERIEAGKLVLPGIAQPMPEHCLVKGRMNERTSPVDGKAYAIGFEMRLPSAWNGRFFHQTNGGLDGFVVPAYGDILGGGPRSNGLLKGFAVLSSDAGHAFERNTPGIGAAVFGRDPQARLDYGYNAVAQLTPMARALIASYYGKAPDKAYLVGSSNGGRHGMVAAARDTGRYDGILVSTPGYNLPRAAVAQVWGAQQFASVARATDRDGRPDIESGFTPAELQLLSERILARCDALDGLADGLVHDVAACQRTFNVMADVPSCSAGAPEGSCLSPAQKGVLAKVFAGPGVYTGLPWDAGVRGADWRAWKFVNSVGPRDAVALAFVFVTPPLSPDVVNGQGTAIKDYALSFSLERDGPKVDATDAVYTQSAMHFMTPPEPTVMRSFVERGGKLLMFHGTADPVFSALDSMRWLDAFTAQWGAKAANTARLYLVPGMNHSRGGPATDQLDMVEALVAWVERGVAPEGVDAAARGVGTAVPNPEVPATWSPTRTRLLCPYPSVARYRGTGDAEAAASFACVRP